MFKTLMGCKDGGMGSVAVRAGLAVLVLVAASCARESVPGTEEARSTVSFTIGEAAGTRASVTPYENVVSSLDVLCFRSGDGLYGNSNRVVASGGETLSGISTELMDGVSYDWYVIANAPAGSLGYTSKAAFLAGLTDLMDGTARSLVMMGSGTVLASEGGAPVPVALDRYACKVTVREVCVEWPDAFASYASVSLGRIALVNVVGTTPWSGVAEAGELWYNRMGIDYSAPEYVRDLTVRQYGTALAEGVPADVESPLYCMPNPVVSNKNSKNAPEWSPRSTRVAVEILLDGFPNWYPVDLPAMACNTHYVINRLTVKGPGSQGPDWPVERDDIQFTVSVEPWVDGDVVPVFQ